MQCCLGKCRSLTYSEKFKLEQALYSIASKTMRGFAKALEELHSVTANRLKDVVKRQATETAHNAFITKSQDPSTLFEAGAARLEGMLVNV